jgi:hypothetical protein
MGQDSDIPKFDAEELRCLVPLLVLKYDHVRASVVVGGGGGGGTAEDVTGGGASCAVGG